MADTSKKVSELETASQVNNDDLVMLSQGSSQSGFASLKTTILAIAQKIVSGINFTSDLQTNNKTITGAINEVAQGGGSGGSGHTILDDSGTSLAQEDDLQFKGTYSHDDSTNGKTVVEITREMTQAQYDLLSADEKKGIIRITDDNYVCDATEASFDNTDTSYTSDDVDGVLNEIDDRLEGIYYSGNLDNLKKTGFYGIDVTSSSNAPSDVPNGSKCNITVNDASGLITQTLYYTNVAVYVRRFYNNSWNAWVKYSPNNSAWTRLGTVTTTTPLNIGSYGSFLIVPKVNGAIPFNSYIIPRLLLSYFHLSVYQHATANWHGILNINANNELTLQQDTLGSSWNSMTVDVLVQ